MQNVGKIISQEYKTEESKMMKLRDKIVKIIKKKSHIP